MTSIVKIGRKTKKCAVIHLDTGEKIILRIENGKCAIKSYFREIVPISFYLEENSETAVLNR